MVRGSMIRNECMCIYKYMYTYVHARLYGDGKCVVDRGSLKEPGGLCIYRYVYIYIYI